MIGVYKKTTEGEKLVNEAEKVQNLINRKTATGNK